MELDANHVILYHEEPNMRDIHIDYFSLSYSISKIIEDSSNAKSGVIFGESCNRPDFGEVRLGLADRADRDFARVGPQGVVVENARLQPLTVYEIL